MNRIYKGSNGSIELTEKAIIISRKGFWNTMLYGLKGEKTIPIKNITSIQFKNVGLFTAGYIQFSIMGSNEARGGIYQAVTDENTVTFKSKKAGFDELKKLIEEKIFS